MRFGHADADGHPRRAAGGNPQRQAFRQGMRFREARAGEQHTELFTAPARDDVANTQPFMQALGDALEDLISLGMAVLVVHGLEMVHVQHQHDVPVVSLRGARV